jgi:hypothetical protein
MNIINKSGADKDPFNQSDRDPWHPHAGKGDRDRSNTPSFKRNFDEINWGPRKKVPGKRTYRYGPRAVKPSDAPFILTEGSRAKPVMDPRKLRP